MTIDVNQIRSVDWSRKVGEPGSIAEGLDDIDQCIKILLATPKGAVEHRPEFGCDAWRYLDYPVNEALPHIVRECTNALARWEPRAMVTGIATSYEASRVFLSIRWTAALGTSGQNTEVAYVLTRPQ